MKYLSLILLIIVACTPSNNEKNVKEAVALFISQKILNTASDSIFIYNTYSQALDSYIKFNNATSVDKLDPEIPDSILLKFDNEFDFPFDRLVTQRIIFLDKEKWYKRQCIRNRCYLFSNIFMTKTKAYVLLMGSYSQILYEFDMEKPNEKPIIISDFASSANNF